MYAVILAGGVGARLWPRSRQTRPKQFTDILGNGKTMIQDTAARLQGVIADDHIYVVTGSQYANLAAEQLPMLARDQIIVEPSGRNTAPAIGLACIHICRRDANAVIAVLPADHVIIDTERFQAALRQGEKIASDGYLVTLGIEATFPHTGYGYIKRGEFLKHSQDDDPPAFTVEQFMEKPNRSTAEAFLASGDYYWNGGIFIGQADRLLTEIARQLPAVRVGLDEIDRVLAAANDPSSTEYLLSTAWNQMPSISIDHGVMEHAESVAVIPLNAGWNDIGSWDALEAVLQQDETDNYVAKGKILTLDSHGNIVYSDKAVVALIDVNNLVVVDTGDTLLIGHKQQMQRVKDIVEHLRALGKSELL